MQEFEYGRAVYESPIGLICIECRHNKIIRLDFSLENETDNPDLPVLMKCKKELDEYFSGKRKSFDIETEHEGTEFRKKVWNELYKIPYGETISYKQLAERIGNPKGVRAVGGANHHNSIVIICPCHRVIGSRGDLVGYGGGLWRKEWLLKHEKNA